MKPTVVTMFSGGGLKSYGAKMAGCELVGAIEYDEAIAGCYAMNVSPLVTVARVQDVDYRQWLGIDGLLMSPPCPNFSVAKSGGEETELDIAMAEACCRAIREINPLWVMLENVWGYRKSKSFGKILDALTECGYKHDFNHLNSADVGVPQTRMRLIMRAVRNGYLPPLPPKVRRWTGWYEAVEDLIPGLPESQFAPWQLARMGDMSKRLSPTHRPLRAFLVNHRNGGGVDGSTAHACIVNAEQPAFTVDTGAFRRASSIPSAFLCSGTDANTYDAADPSMTVTAAQGNGTIASRAFIVPAGGNESLVAARMDDEPAFTVMTYGEGRTKAFVPLASHQLGLFEVAPRTPSLEWLNHGRVVSMTTRCLARFQTIPDCWILPTNNELACKIIGNGMPCLLSQRIVEGLIAATSN